MDRLPIEPAKLLAQWMEWERGDATPGRVMANLKTGGLRELLESLVSASEESSAHYDDLPPPGEEAAGEAAR